MTSDEQAPQPPPLAPLWTAAHIVPRPVSELAAYPGNARTHTPAQVAQIVASIREFGFVNPVVVDEDGEIIAGHGRVLAAKQMGLEAVPTITRAGLSGSQKRALRLADNRIALSSAWDVNILAAELRDLLAIDSDLLGTAGFSTGEVDTILSGWNLNHAALDAVNPHIAPMMAHVVIMCPQAKAEEVKQFVSGALATRADLEAKLK